MSGPRLEAGFTGIPNKLYDAILRSSFTKRELLIVLAVIRKTYGYRKKSDDISLSQLASMTGIDSADCSKTLNDLAAKKVLAKHQGKYGQHIGINKNCGKWKVLAKRQGLANHQGGIGKSPRKLLVNHQTQKTTPKDNTQKEGAGAPTLTSPAVTEETMWQIGMELGLPRSVIGKAVSKSSKAKVAEIIAGMAVNKPVDPVPYLMKVIQAKDEIDYTVGAI